MKRRNHGRSKQASSGGNRLVQCCVTLNTLGKSWTSVPSHGTLFIQLLTFPEGLRGILSAKWCTTSEIQRKIVTISQQLAFEGAL